MKLKTGDRVTVIAGSNKGKSGKILRVLNDKVVVEGVNVVKKHIKPKYNGGTGEITEVEAPIHRSNVKVVSEKKEEKKKTTTKTSTTKKSK